MVWITQLSVMNLWNFVKEVETSFGHYDLIIKEEMKKWHTHGHLKPYLKI